MKKVYGIYDDMSLIKVNIGGSVLWYMVQWYWHDLWYICMCIYICLSTGRKEYIWICK